jgi:hypothetical protein
MGSNRVTTGTLRREAIRRLHRPKALSAKPYITRKYVETNLLNVMFQSEPSNRSWAAGSDVGRRAAHDGKGPTR